MKNEEKTLVTKQDTGIGQRIEKELIANSIELIQLPEIVEHSLLNLLFYSVYDAEMFLNSVSSSDSGLLQRIGQESKEDNWDYYIHPLEVNNDVNNPEHYFDIHMVIPTSDTKAVLDSLIRYNQGSKTKESGK
ncbi:MAG: hypothetical protein HN514_06110 [Candidatus Marinimicrobia bacterium]|jgi:hypothetical protein|nr:hypothetical protein [Candidatus Neomarinimicrobiota bacterium]